MHSGSGLGVLARFAFRRRLIGPRRMVHSLAHDVLFRRRGSTDGHISSVAEMALELAAGLKLADLTSVVNDTAQEIANSVRPKMMDVLTDHLTAGHRCVLLSASPQPLVQEVAELLGVGCGIGTIIEVENGVLTGRIEQPMCYGSGKLHRLTQVTGWRGDTHGEASFAYADSISDLPLLESVGSPVAVSPDRRLRQLAEQRAWRVIDI